MVYLFSSTGKQGDGGGGSERGGCLFQIINRHVDIYKNKTEVGLTFWGRNRGRAVKRQDTLRLKFTWGTFQNCPSNDIINKFPDAEREILLGCLHTSLQPELGEFRRVSFHHLI